MDGGRKLKFGGPGGEEFDSVHRARVNSNTLAQYHGKPVCLLGTVTKADGGGTAFQMRSCDGNPITIRLKSPISEPLTGLVEVYGIGQGKNLILADSFTTIPDRVAADFDLTTYNEVVVLMNSLDSANPWKPSSN